MINRDFTKKFTNEVISSLCLILAALLALYFSNSSYQKLYHDLLTLPLSLQFGSFNLSKPMELWINDGLMSIFFFLVGLELKQQVCHGELKNIHSLVFPGIAAIGGVVIPASIYTLMNYSTPLFLKGWAIPMATDIAFSLGILSLFSHRVPVALKLFLLTLAIIDDLIAITVIAIFHTEQLSWLALSSAGICLTSLLFLNRFNIDKISPYLIFGLLLWASVLKSGFHATLAGFLLALTIPSNRRDGKPFIPTLEEDLKGVVNFVILPLFAFTNAGVTLQGFHLSDLLHPITLGIIAGLALGKPCGVLSFAYSYYLIFGKKHLKLPFHFLYGVACLCGVGFTMSLFLANLAFSNQPDLLNLARSGILSASTLSSLLGGGILLATLPKTNRAE